MPSNSEKIQDDSAVDILVSDSKTSHFFLLFSKLETDLDKQIFYYRSEYFFSQSTLNGLLLMTWTVMMSVLIYLSGLNHTTVVVWTVFQMILSYLIIFFSEKKPHEKSIAQVKRMLVIRLILGMFISFSFSSLLFIIKDTADTSYYIILLGGVVGTFFIMVMSQLYFPDYYYAYGLVYYITIPLAIVVSVDDLSYYACMLALMGGFYGLIKGSYFSFVLINHIYIKLQLTDDKRILSNLKEDLQHASFHDDLTQLPNRRYLYDFFKHLSSNNEGGFLLIYVDLDFFKAINDHFGHDAGDFVLKSASQIISRNIRKTDKAFRIGGDEFCIIIANIALDDDFYNIMHGINTVLKTTVNYQQQAINISASVGYAHYPSDGITLKEVLSIADKKMYTEKKQKSQSLMPQR